MCPGSSLRAERRGGEPHCSLLHLHESFVQRFDRTSTPRMEIPSGMRICVIGCGAVGSRFAAHLAKAGEGEIWAYDVWKDHVEAMHKNGLRISGAAEMTARLHATSDPKQLPHCDYGIVATKAIHTKLASSQVAQAFDEKNAVCSVQNSVGNEEIIAE